MAVPPFPKCVPNLGLWKEERVLPVPLCTVRPCVHALTMSSIVKLAINYITL